MTETYMFRQLRNKLKGFPIKLLRIETGQSLPDLFYYSEQDRFHGWIELKHVPTFDTEFIKPQWQPGQVNRCKALYKSGESVRLLIGSDNEKEFLFIHGFFMREYDSFLEHPRKIKELKGLELYDLLCAR